MKFTGAAFDKETIDDRSAANTSFVDFEIDVDPTMLSHQVAVLYSLSGIIVILGIIKGEIDKEDNS